MASKTPLTTARNDFNKESKLGPMRLVWVPALMALVLAVPPGMALSGFSDASSLDAPSLEAPTEAGTSPSTPTGPTSGNEEEYDVSDPEGDARTASTDQLATTCGDTCEPFAPATELAEGQGAPAPATMDLVGLDYDVTSEDVVMTLYVASLDEQFTGATSQDWDVVYSVYVVEADQDACARYASIEIATGADDSLGAYHEAGYGMDQCETGEVPCNAWYWCAVEFDVSFTFGTPGAIHFALPREILAHNKAGAEITEVGALVTQRAAPTPYNNLAAGTWTNQGSYSVGGSTRQYYSYEVDEASAAVTLALGSPTITETSGSMTVAPHSVLPGGGSSLSDADAEVDLQAVHVTETDTTITFDWELARVNEVSDEYNFHWWAMGLETGEVLVSNLDRFADGSTGAYAVYYDRNDTFVDDFVVSYDIQPGTPGIITMAVDRGSLPTIAAGAHTNLMYFGSGRSITDSVSDDENLGVYYQANQQGSDTGVALQYTFAHDTAPGLDAARVEVEDAVGDAQLPAVATNSGANPAQFDLTGIEAIMLSESVTRFTMSIDDMGVFSVPPGYHAVYYGFGVQIGDESTMVGYYREGDSPRGDFFCAPDNSVLPTRPMDPTRAIWTLIDGFVQGTGSLGGSGSPGALIFNAPHECFGLGETDTLELRSMEAATFLVTNPSGQTGEGQLDEVDRAAMTEPAVLLAPKSTTVGDPTPPVGFVTPLWLTALQISVGIGAAGTTVIVARRKAQDRRAVLDAKAREDRETYKTAIRRAIDADTQTGPLGDDPVLRALRGRLSISDREHALIEVEVRSLIGDGSGALVAGTTFLGKYRIEEQIGAGGYSRALMATDTTLGRPVVLKVSRWATPKAAKQALNEARILAKTAHPSIVAIHDLEVVGDDTVMVLEHMPAGSLKDRLSAGALPQKAAVAMTDSVLSALEVAHGRGVIHRDVKPANILFGADGKARLADFGIAQDHDADLTAGDLSALDEVAGTIRYMAPEQVSGQAATRESDIYAAGVVLYEALTGSSYLGFEAMAPTDMRAAILEQTPRLPAPGISMELSKVLAVALAKDPNDRYRSAGDMRKALQGAA